MQRAASLEQFLLNIESDLAEEQCPEFQISDLEKHYKSYESDRHRARIETIQDAILKINNVEKGANRNATEIVDILRAPDCNNLNRDCYKYAHLSTYLDVILMTDENKTRDITEALGIWKANGYYCYFPEKELYALFERYLYIQNTHTSQVKNLCIELDEIAKSFLLDSYNDDSNKDQSIDLKIADCKSRSWADIYKSIK